MSDVATRKCQNQACEDGWINLRNLTVPPRPCLDCRPYAMGHLGGSRRVPDVEATLRAEVARLTAERDAARAAPAGHRSVTRLEWHAAKDKEPETATHPCDAHSHEKCMCEGACSCHWRKL